MKKFFSLLLSVCMLFSCAMAEAYVPGQIEQQLVAQALENGKMIVSQVNASLEMDAEKLGLSEEEAAIIKAVCETVDMTTIKVGFGCPNGEMVRMTVSADLLKDDTTVAVDAAINVTAEGIVIESGILDSSVSVQWDTLLAMAGMTDEQIAQLHEAIDMILSLSEEEINEMIEALLEQVMELLQQAAELTAPYAETIMNWAAGLNVETIEEDDQSAIMITIAAADVSELINALADQAAADEQMLAVIDMLLTEGVATIEGEEVQVTAADFIELIKELAAEIADDTTAASLVLSTSETGIVCSFFMPVDEGVELSVSFAFDASEAISFSFDAVIADEATAATIQGMTLDGMIAVDPENEQNVAVTMTYQIIENGGVIMSEDVICTTAGFTTEEGKPGLGIDYAVNVATSNDFREVVTMNVLGSENAYGGEDQKADVAVDFYVGEEPIGLTAAASASVTPNEDGFDAYEICEIAMPLIGLNKLEVVEQIACETYEPDASAAVVAVETLMTDEDAMNTFMENTMNNAFELVGAAMEILPAELVNMLMAE